MFQLPSFDYCIIVPTGDDKIKIIKTCMIETCAYIMCIGCGVSVAKQQGAQRRIVGGDEAGFGSFPWQVNNENNILIIQYCSKILILILCV